MVVSSSYPVSLQQERLTAYSVTQCHKDYLNANTVKEQEKVLIRFAKSNAASVSPETYHKMEERLQKISERE